MKIGRKSLPLQSDYVQLIIRGTGHPSFWPSDESHDRNSNYLLIKH